MMDHRKITLGKPAPKQEDDRLVQPIDISHRVGDEGIIFFPAMGQWGVRPNGEIGVEQKDALLRPRG